MNSQQSSIASNTLGPERGAERIFMYLDKRCWPCALRCEVEPDLFQQIPFHQMDFLADRKLVSRRDLLSSRPRIACQRGGSATKLTHVLCRARARGFL